MPRQCTNPRVDMLATPDLPKGIAAWLVRRRVAISLIGFTCLCSINVMVIGTRPLNLWDWKSPAVWMAWTMIISGLAIRSWSAGALNKSRELTVRGPYALTRNPLYVGSFLLMVGFCVLCRDLLTFAFVVGPLLLIYRWKIQSEERLLGRLFSESWADYQARVPRLLPTRWDQVAGARKVGWNWTVAEWLRNREYNAVVGSMFGVWGVGMWHQAVVM